LYHSLPGFQVLQVSLDAQQVDNEGREGSLGQHEGLQEDVQQQDGSSDTSARHAYSTHGSSRTRAAGSQQAELLTTN
jgi:hypothetical protein